MFDETSAGDPSDGSENNLHCHDGGTNWVTNEMICHDCGSIFLADDETFDNFAHAVELDFENEFICDVCIEDQYEDAFPAD